MTAHYICLFFAILLEVTGTMLPASQNFTRLVPTATLAVCYLAAFYLLTLLSAVFRYRLFMPPCQAWAFSPSPLPA